MSAPELIKTPINEEQQQELDQAFERAQKALAIIETYDQEAQKVLLSARQIREYKEEALKYSKRYTDSKGAKIITPPREGNI